MIRTLWSRFMALMEPVPYVPEVRIAVLVLIHPETPSEAPMAFDLDLLPSEYRHAL